MTSQRPASFVLVLVLVIVIEKAPITREIY